MAPKEDMLPPGWDDLDRYVGRLVPELVYVLLPTVLYHPTIHPRTCISTALWNPNARYGRFKLFPLRDVSTPEAAVTMYEIMLTGHVAMPGKWASSL